MKPFIILILFTQLSLSSTRTNILCESTSYNYFIGRIELTDNNDLVMDAEGTIESISGSTGVSNTVDASGPYIGSGKLVMNGKLTFEASKKEMPIKSLELSLSCNISATAIVWNTVDQRDDLVKMPCRMTGISTNEPFERCAK